MASHVPPAGGSDETINNEIESDVAALGRDEGEGQGDKGKPPGKERPTGDDVGGGEGEGRQPQRRAPAKKDDDEPTPEGLTGEGEDDLDLTGEGGEGEGEGGGEGQAELSDEDREDLERAAETPSGYPSWKEIREKFPKLNKEYPQLRKIFYEHQQFTKHLPTPEDAEEAAGKSAVFDEMENGLMQGSPDQLFANMYETDPTSVDRLAKNFLPALRKGNERLYTEIVSNEVKGVLRNAMSEATARQDKNLRSAVIILSRAIYGNVDLRETPEDPSVKQERERLQFEKQKFEEQTRTRFASSIKSEIKSTLMTEIKAALPKHLGDLTRDALANQAIQLIESKLRQDQSHMALMRSYMTRAARAGYTGDWEPRVKDAYLGRARNLSKPIVARLVAEHKPKQGANGNEQQGQPSGGAQNRQEQRRPPASGRPVGEKPKVPHPSQVDWKKTTNEMALAGKFILKGQ